ncbi:MAG: hypothetical protein P1V97_29755 [Planctomycetota bacterium]|nr:hypothetical protein [Planctomycetota bacterium]
MIRSGKNSGKVLKGKVVNTATTQKSETDRPKQRSGANSRGVLKAKAVSPVSSSEIKPRWRGQNSNVQKKSYTYTHEPNPYESILYIGVAASLTFLGVVGILTYSWEAIFFFPLGALSLYFRFLNSQSKNEFVFDAKSQTVYERYHLFGKLKEETPYPFSSFGRVTIRRKTFHKKDFQSGDYYLLVLYHEDGEIELPGSVAFREKLFEKRDAIAEVLNLP